MPCPVTTGFFHGLEHNANEQVRNTTFEFLRDGESSFPTLRATATQEAAQTEQAYAHRAQYAIQVVVSAMSVKAPVVVAPIVAARGPAEMLQKAVELCADIEDLILVSRLKRKTDGANMHRLSERLVVREALAALVKQLISLREGDYKGVGVGLGDAAHGLCLPPDMAMKIGRKLLSIKE